MSTEDTTPEIPDNVYDLSDEEFEKLAESDVAVLDEEQEDTDATDESTDTDDADDDGFEEESDDDESTDDTQDTDEADDDTDDEEDTADSQDTSTTDQESADSDEDDEDDESDDSEDTDVEVDYKTAYQKLTAPFKANGVQMQVKNVDDALTLMKMGANYHKKMAGLKPSLKVVKLLQKHGLLDSEKINYLIDLHDKKPEAITKLVKDSGVNPLEIDVDVDSDYKPETRTVSDGEIVLDNVLESIKDTPTYPKTINVITEQWDEASRRLVSETPQIIEVINEHMSDGTYDAIMSVVTRERSLGRLEGQSDLVAYKTVGDILHQNYQLPGQVKPETATKTSRKPTTGMSEKARKAKKKAVSTTKKTKTTSGKIDYNPLALSDEEFSKISEADFA